MRWKMWATGQSKALTPTIRRVLTWMVRLNYPLLVL